MKQNKLFHYINIIFFQTTEIDKTSELRDNQLLFQVKSGTQMITQLQRAHREMNTEKQTVLKKHTQF